MTLTITNKLPLATEPVKASVNLPGSKSLANRALIIAALAKGRCCISNMLFSDDIKACIQALKNLGIHLSVDEDQAVVTIEGGAARFDEPATIDAREAGTVSRFLLPACAAVGGTFTMIAADRMCARPMDELLDILQAQGVVFDYHQLEKHLPLTLSSEGLSGGNFQLSGNKSSQFLSGLLIAAPLALSSMSLTSQATYQQPYVNMTVELMRAFGVQVAIKDNAYHITSGQAYHRQSYTLEPDISTASYFWAAAALTKGQVTVNKVTLDALQGDIQFLTVLEQMGCCIESVADGICVTGPDQLIGVDVNMRSFSDTFMTVAALAPFARDKTTISGIRHTRLQESDRIEAMATGLSKLGAKVETTDDSITIYPSKMHSGVVSGSNDHRIAMSLALIGLKVPNVVIEGSDCVAKTCPDYFERMQNIIK